MHIAIAVLKLGKEIPYIEGADYVGVDRGALTLAQDNIHMALALGDFDSVNEEEFQKISLNTDEIVRLNPIKDDTDSESAVNHLLERGYGLIILLGAFGGRMDHSFVNLRLAYKHPRVVILQDGQNKVEAYEEGTYSFENSEYRYFSFFTEDTAEVTLEGMKYPLVHRIVTKEDVYTLSNEMIHKKGTLTVHSGKVLVMQTKDA